MDPKDLIWIDYHVSDSSTGDILEEKAEQLVSVDKSTFPKGVKDRLLASKVDDEVEVIVDKPYGDRDPSKIRVVPLKVFHMNRLAPYPGLPVTLDGVYAVVKSVNGGRIIVDFNHPFAGRAVKYTIKISGIVSEVEGKIRAIAKVFKIEDYNLAKNEGDKGGKGDKDGESGKGGGSFDVTVDSSKYKTVLDSFRANLAYFLSGVKVNVIEK